MRIVCFESAWSDDPDDELTVGNMLDDLYSSEDIDYSLIYCVSKRQLKNAVEKIKPRMLDVAYFASHGRPGKLDLKKDTVDVETLSEYMDGRFAGKVIYFAACAVLNLDDDKLRSIVKKTGAKYICGYTTVVDWTQSRAMDTIVLQSMAKYSRPTWLWKHLKSHYDDLMKQTGFYMYW